MDKKRIEDKLMWMNVDPWDSYRWLAEYVLDLEDKNGALNAEVTKLTSTNSENTPCKHPGCMLHVTHPCEGCGRQWGKI